MKILFVGDVVGDVGISVLSEYLPFARDKYNPDLVIVNGENLSASGRGISKSAYNSLMTMGVDLLTSGNHIWDNNDILDIFAEKNCKIIRPANYADSLPGAYLYNLKVGMRTLTVVNLCGQVFMDNLNCPFEKISSIMDEIPGDNYILLDFHAEASSEKIAMGHFLTGKITGIVGTHTHVQTNDAQILNYHTAYISDVGMTGSNMGVIGMDKNLVLERMINKTPVRLSLEKSLNNRQFSAVLIETDIDSTRAKSIRQIRELI